MEKVGIISTIGPSTDNLSVLPKLIDRGSSILRFNFSHGNYKYFKRIIDDIKRLKKRKKVKLLADLKGNRIRVRNINEPILLKTDDKITLTTENIKSGKNQISFDYPYSLKSIKPGHSIFIDDGNIELNVISIGTNYIKTVVKKGSILKNNKGINIPDANLYFPLLNDEDRQDLDFILKNDFDLIAQSFVRTHKDIEVIRKMTENTGIKIIAKIENKQAIRNIDSIIKISDGIMIARGDLGVSLPIYKVPVIQKKLIKLAKKYKKFSIVATQIFESMIEHYRPTRAEVSDLANAIIDGTDYVMFSAETAVGKYPLETVEMAKNVIRYTTRYYNAN